MARVNGHLKSSWESDEKPAKEMARTMLKMAQKINQAGLMRRNIVQLAVRFLIIFGAWTLYALFAASQNYLSRAYTTRVAWYGVGVRPFAFKLRIQRHSLVAPARAQEFTEQRPSW